MFKTHHVLPDELGRQDPQRVIELIDAMNPNARETEYTGNDPYLRMFYGM